MRALIVSDGGAAYVLPAARSLARAGWEVGLGQPALGMATRSRFCREWHQVRCVEHGLDAFLEDVATAVRRGGYDLVLPGDDIEVLALSEGREAVPAVVPYAEHAAVVRALDKVTLSEAAAGVGIATPRTTAVDGATFSGPVVVKARLHWNRSSVDGFRHLPVRIARSQQEVDAAAAHMRERGGEPFLQELVDGELMAVSAVCDAAGRLRAVSQQVTERSSLRRTSARARTVALDDDLVERVRRLLEVLGWQGLANLQFLRRSGSEPLLIDLNPRFYGSLALAVAAGADLPRVWAELAVGRDPGELLSGRPGVRFSALDEDLLRARAEPAPVRAALESLRYGVGAAHSVGDLRDPLPAVHQAGRRAVRVARRAAPLASRFATGVRERLATPPRR